MTRSAFCLPYGQRGTAPILFCVHPAGGLSWGYMSLARYVPEDFRHYGLQVRALDGTSEFPASVRDMAADYIEQIKTVQSAGPYRLLGYSLRRPASSAASMGTCSSSSLPAERNR